MRQTGIKIHRGILFQTDPHAFSTIHLIPPLSPQGPRPQHTKFLAVADRTNGRAYATVMRLSSVTLCIVVKRCVLEQVIIDSL